jgi:hypothetical protein
MVNKSLFSRLFGTANRNRTEDMSDPVVLPEEFPGFEHEAEAYAAEEPPLSAFAAHEAQAVPSGGQFAVPLGSWAEIDPPAAISGVVDSLEADGASGWAFDTARPHTPVTVAAFLGEACIGEVSAGLYRSDVEARTGSGAHGFRLNFSPPMAPGQLRQVSVIAAGGRPCVLRAPQREAPQPQALEERSASQALEETSASQEIAVEPPPQVGETPLPKMPAPSVHRPEETATAPIFIIGCAPDMSAKLALALMKATGLPGSEHGHLLPLALMLTRTVNQYYRNTLAIAETDALIRRVDVGHFQQAIRHVFIDLIRQHFPSGDWVDNSQGLLGIQSVPVLRSMWPGARFIFVSSRVIECVAARQVLEPKRDQRELATAWAREMQTWLDLRDRVGPAAVSVDHFALAHRPAEAAGEIAAFLNVGPVQTESLAQALSAAVTSHETVPSPEVLAGWHGGKDETIRLATAPMMTAYGYSWDDGYFAHQPTGSEHASGDNPVDAA